jgi:hypothetical protein
MKHRLFLTVLIISFALFAKAQDTVSLFNKGILAGNYIVKAGQTSGGIWYKKKQYKKMGALTIEIKGKSSAATVYKRTLELDGDSAAVICVAAETRGIPGQFEITNNAVKKRLAKGKPVTLYLLMNPANDKMKIASRRLYMGTLTAK